MSKLKGNVKFFNYQRGFGFVEVEGADYFVHVTDVNGDMLLGGEEVLFTPAEGHKGMMAREVERVNPPVMAEEVGEVMFYNPDRGFGFIGREAKADVFAHFTDFEGLGKAEDVQIGMKVQFEVRSGRDGRDRAYKIRLV